MPPLPRIVESFQSSVRYKLLFLVLSPLVVVLPILLVLMLYQGSAFFDRLLNFKIHSDLVVAHEYMDRVISGVGSNVGRTAESYQVVSALEGEETQAIALLLAEERERNTLDFLNLFDAQGNLLAAGNEQTRRDGYSGWRVVQTAAAGRLETQIDLFSSEQLAGISERLRETAFIPILPTENAAPSDRKSETRGMVVHAAAPIFNEQKQLAGILHGGLLLNRHLDFVDTINSIVYKAGSLPLGSQGTVTLFLDDVR
ncbi:MAG: two-component sensor histidine kinase, partial [Burkholderiales bacterium]